MFSNKQGYKFYKKALIFIPILLIAMAFTVFVPPTSSYAAVPAFNDLPYGDKYYPFVSYLVGKGLVNGYPDGSFKPSGYITRAEMAALLVKSGGIGGQGSDAPKFSDVEPGHWACGVINQAAQAGLITGYPDGTFKPQKPVSRAEVSALLLRLTREPLTEVPLPGINDVGPGHWARKQVAAAIDAGLMAPVSKNSFSPDAPTTRAQVARGLAVMLNISPESRDTPLTGTLIPVNGEINLTYKGQEFRSVKENSDFGAGAVIATGSASRAEIKFPDGTGLRLEENTELTVVEARGRSNIMRDGSTGITVDTLELKLSKGKIFGALASTYARGEINSVKKTALFGKGYLLADASGRLPSDLLLALVEQKNNLPWWQVSSQKRAKVKVDMPWGICAVRGTFWMNQVGAERHVTNVVNGAVDVIAAERTVTVPAGQTTNITSPGAPPAPAARMTPAEQEEWLEVQDWVTERAIEIENAAPVIVPSSTEQEVLMGLPYSNMVDMLYRESVSGVSPPVVTATDPAPGTTALPAGRAVSVTFSEDVLEGDAYNNIQLQDVAGNNVQVNKSITGKTLRLRPEASLAGGVPVNGTIVTSFDIPVKDDHSVSITLTGGGKVITLNGKVIDKQLSAPYSDLAYGTEYTVSIPAGSVQSLEYGTFNDEITWRFKTAQQERLPGIK